MASRARIWTGELSGSEGVASECWWFFVDFVGVSVHLCSDNLRLTQKAAEIWWHLTQGLFTFVDEV